MYIFPKIRILGWKVSSGLLILPICFLTHSDFATMSSPFKFLDSFTREDRDQFFGRDEETTQLYELVNQNRLVLLYGPSGTGKTSLIQCGLGNRFEATDWLPMFIRRGSHLPTSLQKALVDHWDEELDGNFWSIDENPLPTIVEDLFAEYLRPIYLVFDQLEEIFILGDEEEQRIFTQAMADIYHAKLPCQFVVCVAGRIPGTFV